MIVKPSIAFNDFAGSAKGVTARNVKGRNILSSRAQHSKSITPAQAVSRNRLSLISRSYKKLTSVQMNGWASLAERMKGISTLGNPPALQGVEAPVEAVVTLTPTKFTFKLEGESAAAPKVFIKYFFVNAATGEKSGEMMTLAVL